MPRWSVSVSHLTQEQLAFLGYRLIKENEAFCVYEDYMGDDHIVQKANPYMVVEDFNDALAINSTTVMNVPDEDD